VIWKKEKIMPAIQQPPKMRSPTPDEIRDVRLSNGHTQAAAAAVVHGPSYRTWQDWESGAHAMKPWVWELYLLKTRPWLIPLYHVGAVA
jgi:putative transcriptional regulator